MTDDQKAEALHEMFQSEGGKILIEQLNTSLKAILSIDSCNSEKDLWMRKGEARKIREILSLKEVVAK